MVILFVGAAFGHADGAHDWPQYYEGAADIASWTYEDGWYVSPVRSVANPGIRLGLFAQKPSGTEISLEARYVQDHSVGEWLGLYNAFRLPMLDLLIYTFEEEHSSIQFRTLTPQSLHGLEWDIVNPVYEAKLPADTLPPPSPTQLSQSLVEIGVGSRSDWGAQPTTCVAPEDEWYRMAIHHIASSQTLNGSVAERIRAVQAWAISSNEYCDIPYQYLVGYDGSLWEGRPIGYYSGATGGGQNNGNIALSFVGCYDEGSCTSSFGFYHQETESMMARAREIIQVLAAENDFSVDDTTVKGHREWPDNATSCPGDFVMNRFDELLSPNPPYSGEVLQLSHHQTIEMMVGETVNVWVDVTNTGQRDWGATTKLAPLPRDQESPLADPSWESASRVVSSTTTETDAIERFSFVLSGNQIGSYTQYFNLVEEGFTWFSDTPYAGSPTNTSIVFSVNVVEAGDTSGDTNRPPVSDAGEDQTVFVAETVYLDASYSTDPDGDPISFAWSSAIPLIDGNTATPYFIATDPGDYEITLSVTDELDVSTDSVQIVVLPQQPPDLAENESSQKRGCSQVSGNLLHWLLGAIVLILRRKQRLTT